MALIIKDRVKEGTTSTGTGSIIISGHHPLRLILLHSVMTDGDTTYYAIVHTSSGVDEWEVGLGTWNTGNTLTRTTVLAGSGGTSAVDFSAGTKDVFMTYPSAIAAYTDGSGDLSSLIGLGNHTTTDLAEGSNLYFNTGRIDSHLSGGTGVTYNAGAISIGQAVATTSNVTFNTVTLSGNPATALQAATKEYVDTIAAAGIHYHELVRVEAAANRPATYDNGTSGVGATLTNSGTQEVLVIDGVTVDVADRVLLQQQTNSAHNGIYTVTNVGSASTNWVLTRAVDADSYHVSDKDALGEGDAFFVKEGLVSAGDLYVMNTSGVITFGTTPITFTIIAETAIYTAGTGLTLTGTEFATAQDIAATASPTFVTVNANLLGNVTGNVTGNVSGTSGSTTGNAATATKLATARTVQLSGDVTGSASFDGSANINIVATVGDDSHAHIISNVDGLQAALDAKVDDTQTITAGTGLTGGGTLGVNRTLALDTAYTDTRYVNAIGDTMTGNLSFGDNNKAIFGAGSDLQIYHDGSASRIHDNGTGNLIVSTTDFQMNNGANNETMMTAVSGGAVTLKFAGSNKLATSATGIDVNGTVVADGLNVGVFGSTGRAANLHGENLLMDGAGPFDLLIGDGGIAYMSISTTDNATAMKIRNFSGNSDIAVFERTTGRVGIGTATPTRNLSISSTGQTDLSIRSGDTSYAQLLFGDATADNAGAVAYDNATNTMHFHTVTSAEAGKRMTIDSSGNVLVGKTASGLANSGFEVGQSGQINVTQTGATVGRFNRKTSDGSILEFAKDGTTVGSIGVQNTYLTIGKADTGIKFQNGVDGIHPWDMDTNASRDAAIDLGTGTARFKNLYLSGTANATTFSGALSGNATTATALQTARTINGVSFNGTANITVADGTKLPLAGGTMTGDILYGTNDRDHSQMGTYDSTKTQQIWSMGAAYRNNATGVNFGNLYGMSYKHDNNATGGTMAVGHQIVFTSNGTPGAAIGMAGNIWTSGVSTAATFNATSVTSGGFQGIDADTITAPSFTWTSDLNTGMWHAAADAIGFTTAGVNRITINNSGISGAGAGLTGLNGSNISSGTVAAARVATLNQSTTGNAATATALQTARTINGVSFNGTANITVADSTKAPIASPTFTGTATSPTFNASSVTNGGFQGIDADTALIPSFTWTSDQNTGMWHAAADQIGFATAGVNRITINSSGISGNGSQLSSLNASNISSGTIAAARVPTLNQSTTGNATTATRFQTARTINGVSFNGTANITVADSTKAPTANPTFTGTVTSPTFNATSVTSGGFQGIDADTIAAPSFTWTSDLNTGMWHAGADQIGFTTGGVNRATISTTAFDTIIPMRNTGNYPVWENKPNFAANYTITNGYNAMSAGPITINSGITVTVGAGETWTVV